MEDPRHANRVVLPEDMSVLSSGELVEMRGQLAQAVADIHGQLSYLKTAEAEQCSVEGRRQIADRHRRTKAALHFVTRNLTRIRSELRIRAARDGEVILTKPKHRLNAKFYETLVRFVEAVISRQDADEETIRAGNAVLEAHQMMEDLRIKNQSLHQE